MNKTYLILLAALLLSLASVQAQYLEIYGRRCTFIGTRVTVFRTPNDESWEGPPDPPSKQTLHRLDDERTLKSLYPTATLLVSGTAYQIKRNCHDFAWGPWMSWEGYPNSVAWVGSPDPILGPDFTPHHFS
jgi:hypothetical protein